MRRARVGRDGQGLRATGLAEWLPAVPATAMVLACGLPGQLAAELRDRGLAVFVLEAKPAIDQLAEAGLQLRKRDPYLPLFVIGPKRLVERFRREFPALSDRTFEDDGSHRWTAALKRFVELRSTGPAGAPAPTASTSRLCLAGLPG
ncbi:MAG: hypothetical protein KGJ86_12470 [Chloroflexota bacterium]|nr:hypothetical protein [Chloroflexota bacterium]